MKSIILNCLPPFGPNIPSPALSILKSWLTKYKFDTKVIYWNLLLNKLQSDFVWNNPKVMEDISNELALYVNYVVLKNKNGVLRESFKQVLRGYSPHYHNDKYDYYDEHMLRFSNKIDEIIDVSLSEIDFANTLLFGFSIKMEGWIVASIIAQKIKKIAPEIPIVIGGINTKRNAKAFLESFPQFDIAMWGEGEVPLVELATTIENESYDYCNISNIAYREKMSILFSQKRNKCFSDMSATEIYPDYDDYFSQREIVKMNGQCIIPIEGSRGCHWNRCKFCYLNEDYKYRLKSVDKIVTEIQYMIEKHGVYCFEFLDNDFIGLDLERANLLLDKLIQIKKEYSKFEIVTVEVITKGLNHDMIKKMFDAGVTFAQIGYESTSSNLLKKINKKNTFASNLFYVKMANLYNVPLYYVNLIINMPDETMEDVIESIENLKYLRFFMHPVNFRHVLTPVEVNTISRYYPRIKDEISTWTPSKLAYQFLVNEFDENFRWDVFSYIKQSRHYLWNTFLSVEKYYLDNKYTYTIKKGENVYEYCEYVNGRSNVSINIEVGSVMERVLYHTNNEIVSLKDLCNHIYKEFNYENFDCEIVKSCVKKIAEKGLLYHSPDYSEIVSVINLDV